MGIQANITSCCAERAQLVDIMNRRDRNKFELLEVTL